MNNRQKQIKAVSDTVEYLEGRIADPELVSVKVKSKLESRLNKSRRKLSSLVNGISITDHALVRYLDRVLLIDVEKVRDDLTTYMAENDYKEDGVYKLGNGAYAVVTDKSVKTITPSFGGGKCSNQE